MRRPRPALIALLLVLSFGAGLGVPRCAVACSCIPPQPIATYGEQAETVIMSGTVVNIGIDQRGAFQVERWYHGTGAVAVAQIRGGDGANCGLFMETGQRLVVVAYRGEDGILQPSICAPAGDLSTPEGQKLLAETEAAFGPGLAPGGEETPTDPDGGFDLVPVLIGGSVVLVLVVFGFVALSVLRRDDRPA